MSSFLIAHSGPCQRQSQVNARCGLWIPFHFATRFISMYWIWRASNSPSDTSWQAWGFPRWIVNYMPPTHVEKKGMLKATKDWVCSLWMKIKGCLPTGSAAENPPLGKSCRRCGFDSWVRKVPWRRAWPPTPVLLPGESHGQRSLVGYSPWGHKESDTTEVT